MPNLNNPITALAEDRGITYEAAKVIYNTSAVVTKPPRRVAQYDAKGKLIGYLVTTYNADGSENPATFEAATAAPTDTTTGQSAWDDLVLELKRYGLESLAEEVKGLIKDNLSASGLTLALQQTDAYKKRFSANEDRIKNGLAALSPAEYVALEDQYQNLMRNYGLPASYYTKDSTGKQAGFDQLLANDVDATELEERLILGQNKIAKASKEIQDAFQTYYGDILNKGDILAYVVDPTKGLEDIKRKVAAAEIGGAASAAGLNQISSDTTPEQKAAMRRRSEELAAAGVTGAAAQQQYGTVAELAARGGQLADIYKAGPYGQAEAEAEIFNVTGQTQAAQQRKKITALEKAAFSGSAGASKSALERERANAAGSI